MNRAKSPRTILKCYMNIFISIQYRFVHLFSDIILIEILWNICIHYHTYYNIYNIHNFTNIYNIYNIHLQYIITLFAVTLHLSGNVMDYINIKRMEIYIEISFFTDCCNAFCSFRSFKYMQSSLTTST